MTSFIDPTSAHNLLHSWGFDGQIHEQLFRHAQTVEKCRHMKTGEILVAIDLAQPNEVEAWLASKPAAAKTLEWIKGQKSQIAARYDEILAIKEGRAFVSAVIPELRLHPVLDKISERRALKEELERLQALPLICRGKSFVAFSDLMKLIQFTQMDRPAKTKSPFYKEFESFHEGELPELHYVVLSGERFGFYRSRLDNNDPAAATTQHLQTIDQSMGDEDPLLQRISDIVNLALQKEASDIDFEPTHDATSYLVNFRIRQRMCPTGIVLQAAEATRIINILMSRSKANPQSGRLQHPVDGNMMFELKNGDAFCRASFIPLENSNGEKVSSSLRMLPRDSKPVDLYSLNISSEIIEELLFVSKLKYGFFLVCGPTNSGKSTSIAGMLEANFKQYGSSKKRISIENPVERKIRGVRAIDASQYNFGNGINEGSENMPRTLKYILRHDPDIIFIGEIREKEGCEVALAAANTGHLVLATTHANTPVMGIRRLIDMVPKSKHFDLINVLTGVMVQRLVAVVCPHCSHEMAFTDSEFALVKRYCDANGVELKEDTLPATYRKPGGGCDRCGDGYSNMVPIHGLLMMNPQVRELLLSEDGKDWLKAQEQSKPNISIFESAFKLFREQRISLDDLLM